MKHRSVLKGKRLVKKKKKKKMKNPTNVLLRVQQTKRRLSD